MYVMYVMLYEVCKKIEVGEGGTYPHFFLTT
jgi:hypothetical protein